VAAPVRFHDRWLAEVPARDRRIHGATTKALMDGFRALVL
jgi:hypothetical protein